MRLIILSRVFAPALALILTHSYGFSQCNNTVTTFPHPQNFETGLENWYQDDNDDFDWYLHSGATSSNNTGPSSAYEGSNYMYTERSGLSSGDEATLMSPCILPWMRMAFRVSCLDIDFATGTRAASGHVETDALWKSL